MTQPPPPPEEQQLAHARELVLRNEAQVATAPMALDGFVPLLGDIYEAMEAEKFWKNRVEKLKKQLAAVLGDSQQGTVGGEEAVTFEPINKFSAKAFREKYPNLYRAYITTRTVEEIDEAALKLTRPELYAEFQTRPMRVTWKPPGSGPQR